VLITHKVVDRDASGAQVHMMSGTGQTRDPPAYQHNTMAELGLKERYSILLVYRFFAKEPWWSVRQQLHSLR